MSEVNWRIGGMDHLESPWGNAGGVVKKREDVERMARTGVGWIEAGSYTPEKRYGNQRDGEGNLIIDPETDEPVIVYHHDSASGETTNSIGMENQGADELEKEIPEMIDIARSHGKEIVFNLAPVTDDPVGETKELVHRMISAGGRRILINAGCPNVKEPGLEEVHMPLSYEPQALGRVALGLSEVVPDNVDIYFRTSPYEDLRSASQAYWQLIYSGIVKAIWVPNTWPLKPGTESPLGVPGGGRSGPKWAADATVQTGWAVAALKGTKIDVVSSSGIMNAAELKARLSLGAAAGAGTTFYYESEQAWVDATDKLLHDFAA